MIATAPDNDNVYRWVVCAVTVIGLHAAFVATLTSWNEHVVGDEGSEAIVVDLAPANAPLTENKNDLAPGPEQQQSTTSPNAQPPKPEEEPEKKIETPPPQPNTDVQLPAEVKPPDKPIERPTRPLTEATSPPRRKPSAAQVSSWHRKIAMQVERYKRYPASSRAHHETGTTQLSFTLDRNGKVLASHVTQTSGFASLDQETIDTVRRAQPFPPPPADMPGEAFDFTVPIRFNIR
jgi:periplasmic protein TonB